MDPRIPRQISFGREICGQFEQAERREWWLANGLGGYAAGTLADSLTRRYHGLLVAPLQPPLRRVLVVAKADATLCVGDRQWPLFANRWHGGLVDPDGHVFIESFRLEGRMPVWRYAVGGVFVEKRLWMEPGAHTTYLAFRLLPDALGLPAESRLQVRILVNDRDHHGQSEGGAFDPSIAAEAQRLRVSFARGQVLQVLAAGGSLQPERYWVENVDLPAERERGLPDRDSHLCPGHAVLEMRPGQWAGLVFSLHPDVSPALAAAMERFQSRDAAILAQAEEVTPLMGQAPDWVRQLVLAADSFVFARPLPEIPDGESVIAGYPWFGDWGRDTMIALPGLTLALSLIHI